MGEETLFEGLLGTEPVCSNSFSGKHLIYARSELLPGSYLEFGQYIEIACRLCIYLDNSWLIVPGLTAIDTKEIIIIPPDIRSFELALWLFPSWSCHFQIIGVG